MFTSDWEDEMQDLVSAEDFLEFFEVPFDPHVVRVNRLHILQRFHDNLQVAAPLPEDAEEKYQTYAEQLTSAYNDFVHSTPKQEKALRVYQSLPDEPAFVPLSALSISSD